MRINRAKKDIPTLDTTATADISFILLIFFLVATSFNSYKGLEKNVTPDNEERIDKTQIKQRNVFQLHLHADNTITQHETPINENELCNMIMQFVENEGNASTRPERTIRIIPGIGKCSSTYDHQMILTIDRDANYYTYYNIQNSIQQAYKALRDKAAKQYFSKTYDNLTPAQQHSIRQVYPIRLTEETQ